MIIYEYWNKISLNLRKEILRFFLCFFLAWGITIFLNDLPKIKNLIISTPIDDWLRSFLVWLTEKTLNITGFETYSHIKYLKIIGTPGVRFEFGCLGIRHISLFMFFILFHYGRIINKLIYIIIGILILTFANALRATVICIGQFQNPINTDIIHDIATPVLMYPVILLLWLIWMSIHTKSKK